MARSLNVAAQAADRIASVIDQAQALAVAAIGTATATVAGVVPDLPATVHTRLPAPADVINGGFGLAERVLDTQRAYALTFAEAFEPLTAKLRLGQRRA